MKTKTFKLVLPVMALIMAITASFAFTSVDNNNSMEEDVLAVIGFKDLINLIVCLLLKTVLE